MEDVLVVRDLRMRYGKTDVLKGVSFAARRGEVLVLLGPNGAGKTTTIEILEGFRIRSAGEVRVLGADPAHGGEAWRASSASARVALPLVGAHQALNASAAAAAGLAAGVPLDVAAAALATASLSKWRLELSSLAGGATLLNDSYNADPDSARAALDALAAIEGGRRIAVLGMMLELGDGSEAEHRAVGEYAASRADVVVAVGEAAMPIADGAGERAVTLAGNAAAVDWLRDHVTAGDVVLVKASREARLDEVAAALA